MKVRSPLIDLLKEYQCYFYQEIFIVIVIAIIFNFSPFVVDKNM